MPNMGSILLQDTLLHQNLRAAVRSGSTDSHHVIFWVHDQVFMVDTPSQVSVTYGDMLSRHQAPMRHQSSVLDPDSNLDGGDESL